MLARILEAALKSVARTAGSVQTRKMLNHGDTRWECQSCGSIKPKVAKKYESDSSPICLKCNKNKE